MFGMGGPGMSQAGAMLLQMPEVSREVALTDAQQKSVEELRNDLQQQMREVMEGINFQELQSLTPEERDGRFAGLRKKNEENSKKSDEKLAKILDAKQLVRLNQLQLQRDLAASLTRPDIIKQLLLADEQLEKIRGLQGAFGPFVPPDQRERQQAELLAVLTDSQKTKWAELKGKDFTFPQQGFGGGGFGGPGGPGGFGGPMGGQELKVVKQFDKDGNGWLNAEERTAAREFVKTNRPAGGRGFGGRGGGGGPGGGGFGGGPGGGGFGGGGAGFGGGFGGGPGPGGRGPGGFGGGREPGKPGPKVAVADVTPVSEKVSLYDEKTLRTLFFEFENPEWETELSDFHNTDVEVPATLTVDGKKYPNVGLHFRGMSSYGGVPAGSKRSLNVAVDLADSKQRLLGYKTLNLLNAHEDASFMSTVLYSHVARKYIPAPKANFVKVVINGESWGIYANVQQFNKEFLAENYKSTKGTRWKVRGSPGGGGGLDYVGDNIEDYKRRYEIKTDDGDKAWKELITLCKTLGETPPDKLEQALRPILDVDGLLWFLALDVSLINCDGYWIRASDYSIFRNEAGKFHVVPHDMNEAFRPGQGPGFGGGPGGGRGGRGGFGGGPGGGPDGQPGAQGGPPGGVAGGPGGGPRGSALEIDPLIGMDDARKPLRSKVLAVPSLRAKYLEHVKTIAEESLDWKNLGPVVAQYRALIEKEVETDTRKLEPFEAFQRATADTAEAGGEPGGRGPRSVPLRAFADQRRAYLLKYKEPEKSASAAGARE